MLHRQAGNGPAAHGVPAFVRARSPRLLATALVASALGAGADQAALAPPLPKDKALWVGEPALLPDPGRRVTLLFVWTFG
jgi:hypothetical protein